MTFAARSTRWLKSWFAATVPRASGTGELEAPLRAELFSADQMEEHGETLARFHRVQTGRARNGLLVRLDENEAVLVSTCALLSDSIRDGRRVTPASEWLLDNYYLVDEHLRTARRHFPRGYSWQLPRLANGVSRGRPRIYDIALNAISHGDGRFDQQSLHRFVAAYQRVAPLSLGELWAIPIMLRLALIENLRRVATHIAVDRSHRDLAARWGQEMAQVVARDPKSLILVVADMARSEPPVSSSFVAELMQRLQGQSASLALPVSWLEQRLSEAGLTIEQLVQSENQQQAADQMSVSNSVASLRLLLSTDWRGFVEGLSRIEQLLSSDPAGVYAKMDFATRDDYRHVVERLARKAKKAEEDVAAAALLLAQDAAAAGGVDSAQAHVGYFLVDAGLAQLELGCGSKPSRQQVPLAWYIVLMVALTLAFAGAPAAVLWQSEMSTILRSVAIVLLVIASSQLAMIVVNWIAALFTAPQSLPKMDYSRGIPVEAKTLVVVPTLLSSEQAAEDEVDDLEIRYLANRDGNLRFAILGDFVDAASEHCAGDTAILDAATRGIERLNECYAEDQDAPLFFLLHRPRRWNAREGTWMGEERKRGKLADLNALLRGADGSKFIRIVGEVAALRHVRYVITLDADTQLPRDTAHELVGTMQHPLNRPRFGTHGDCVDSGYGILQPRVGTTLLANGASLYASLFGGDPGLDPYTRAVSDVYQDLFGEGSFTGKGIYDVDAFEHALAGRMPDNRILSHDLLEGCHARAGLASDISLFEHFPQRYAAEMQRRHRWIRGDWQIARWLFPRVPRADGSTGSNPLSALSRWKIFDNLRRSLVAPTLLVLFVLGWTVLPVPVYWTAILLQLIFVPVIVEALLAFVRKPSDATWRQHVGFALGGGVRRFAQAVFSLACLPHEAYVSADAIVRTLWRQWISGRHLLEWMPSSVAERNADRHPLGLLRRMLVAPFAAVAVTAALVAFKPEAVLVALPILAAWFVSPWLAWFVSRPARAPQATLDAVHRPLLRDVARRTWHFFERYVGADDHALPPDNFQEHPGAVVAHRTSPTNIGLSLLASLAAHDFGYVSVKRLLARTQATFDTLDRLERYRGHFFNWYDTRTLAPLPPRYVSTVDSGNLAGHLLTLRQGLLALESWSPADSRMLQGIVDTARVAQRIAVSPTALVEFIAAVEDAEVQRAAGDDIGAVLITLVARSLALVEQAANDDPGREWLALLHGHCEEALAEHTALATTTRMSLAESAAAGSAAARDVLARADALAERAAGFGELDHDFLYDRSRDLFHIGFNVEDHRRDAGYYDLLASEARLGIFVAIAQGQIPQKGWFSLGRLLIQAGGAPVLLSWSGSMFEYLMPNLVMPTYPQSLLESTSRAAVARQIDYGRERDVPWGVSECGYHLTDAAQNYQYRAFGVPGLGLQRGLSQELVIAPYATALGLLSAPNEAAANLQRMVEQGWLADCGFYEAIDFTATRLPPGQRCAVVRSFMAHHQGMSLLAIGHVLFDRPMQRRFQADAHVQSALLLLQERLPRVSGQPASDPKLVDARNAGEAPAVPLRVFNRPDPRSPAIQLLSNGRYHVMLTSAGGGYSRWRDLAVTRWNEDATRDASGTFCYLRDVGSGRIWSTAFHPTLQRDEGYEAVFTESRVEFRRRLDGWETHTEIVVSPEDDIELRRTRITNRSSVMRTIEVTSFAEIVLAPPISDALHPAFSKLFVQTEIVRSRDAIICTRRPRDRNDASPSVFHLLAVHEGESSGASFETDRARFIGRGRSAIDPQAIASSGPLSGSEGSVLDPVVAIRHRIRVKPEQTVHVDLVIGVGRNRDHCLQLADTYHDRRLADRVIDLAWTHSRVSLRQINISEAEAQTYARLAGCMLYSHPSLRADAQQLVRNRRSQSALWAYAISGDLPIILVRIGETANLGLVRDAVQAHAYWRLKGVAADLVIWNEERGGYRQELQDAIIGMIAASIDANVLERPGGIFVRSVEQITHEDRLLFLAVARVVLGDKGGTLSEHLHRREVTRLSTPLLQPSESARAIAVLPAPAAVAESLQLDNGTGGFSADGREYVITHRDGSTTPAPWINVIANRHFGFIVSDSASGYTWRENAHEYRLTPWHNDPVSDSCGEAFYIRDEETGRFWSPAPLPVKGSGTWTTRHGFGYSVFEHVEDGIHSEQRFYVSPDSPVKFFVLRLRNGSGRKRALSATGYVEWVLGDLSQKGAMHTVTELDPRSGALFARNPFHTEFGEWVSFFDVDEPERTLSGDRLEFIGRNGHLSRPAAMASARLSGRVGAGMDPCGAIQIPFELQDGQTREIIFRLGASSSGEDASALVQRMRKPGSARAALTDTATQWNRLLGAVEIDSPDPTLNALANGWLLYQVIASRLWGRSGYYQSGGAFGFRDQLQDTMALVHAAPHMLREQILLCASRQFKEGDVQHWWHPPANRGVRTRCSDDYLWLPLATCRYTQCTGDRSILDERRPFLEGRALNAGEESYYDLPLLWDDHAPLYDHCVRAIEHGLRMGPHGLPLMGSGDWNDGMNNVGLHGVGESVWLGFFLHRVLIDFAPLAEQRGDTAFASRCATEAATLRANLEAHGWDGDWYRRAYFDDGTPLGSHTNEECRIDSIAQSWSVLSGAAPDERVQRALDSLDTHLVRREAGLIQLLDPPFDKAPLDPGYIRGYVPGVRENGGQYTHAAIWAVMAFVEAGRTEQAWQLFNMINPLRHALTPEDVERYKVEPYVAAADVYAIEPHVGRGGWTWYTGSAGWLYRLITESLLGIHREGNRLRIDPRLPAAWPGFRFTYRFGTSTWRFNIIASTETATANGGTSVDLVDDGAEHAMDIVVARS